jgi:hypothetical protein
VGGGSVWSISALGLLYGFASESDDAWQHEPDRWKNRMTIHKLRIALAALTALIALAAFTATATAYQSAEHATISKHLVIFQSRSYFVQSR